MENSNFAELINEWKLKESDLKENFKIEYDILDCKLNELNHQLVVKNDCIKSLEISINEERYLNFDISFIIVELFLMKNLIYNQRKLLI